MSEKKNMLIVKVKFMTPGGIHKIYDTIRVNSTEEILEKLQEMNTRNRKYHNKMELVSLEAIDPWK